MSEFNDDFSERFTKFRTVGDERAESISPVRQALHAYTWLLIGLTVLGAIAGVVTCFYTEYRLERLQMSRPYREIHRPFEAEGLSGEARVERSLIGFTLGGAGLGLAFGLGMCAVDWMKTRRGKIPS